MKIKKEIFNIILFIVIILLSGKIILKTASIILNDNSSILIVEKNKLIRNTIQNGKNNIWSWNQAISDDLGYNQIVFITDNLVPVMTYTKNYGGDEYIAYNEKGVPDYFFQSNEEVLNVTEIIETTEQMETAEATEAINTNVTGYTYSLDQLSDYDFLTSNFYIIDSTTNITSNELDASKLLELDMTMDLKEDEYKILIYHTHGSEAYIDSESGVIEDSIIGVGDTLTQILYDKYGIKAYHDRSVYDVIDGKIDTNYAYTMSGYGIDKILAENPSIEVIIDLHRDGVREDVHLVTEINGRPTAQIMFFNGLSRTAKNGDIDYLYNPNKQANLAFSLKMQLESKELYPDLTRKIYLKGYLYNLDRRPKATLVEVGAQTNTVEEANNAMEPFAEILYNVLSGK